MSYQLRNGTGFPLLRCAGLLKKRLEQQLRPFNITPVQLAVLGLLWESDNLLQCEIAEQLGKDRPNISRVVEKMADKGWVIREKDPQDHRASRVLLADTGYQMRPQLEQLALEFRAQTNNGLSDHEQQQLIRLLNKLLDNLK